MAKFLTNCKWFRNHHRGLVTVTGYYKGHRISISTTGMGGASTGIVLPELVRSGARLFIRVGTCGSLIKASKPGQTIIVNRARRHDGASENWAVKGFPAIASRWIVAALRAAAKKITPNDYFVGEECTTSCFVSGQGRPGLNGRVPKRMLKRHQKMMKEGVACYSMEAATIFVWCAKMGFGIPSGALNAIVANRHTNEFDVKGEKQAALIAFEATLLLRKHPRIKSKIAKVNAALKAAA